MFRKRDSRGPRGRTRWRSSDPRSLARRYCRLLADGSGVDEQAIWEWGRLERVTTGLYVWSLGGSDQNRLHLDTAELLI